MIATLDFETEEIEARPSYPPRAVGFSLKVPEWKETRYFGWGHPEGNTCTKTDAKRALKAAYAEHPILCHNAKFDLDVASTEFGVPLIPPHGFHDTMFLLFLDDPHSRSLALKPAATRLLGIEPEETEYVRDWLIGAGIVRRNDRKWGRYISKAPANLVAARATGDVRRTRALFDHLAPRVVGAGMAEAYRREQRLLPLLVLNERRGVRVNLYQMRRDQTALESSLETVDAWLRKELKAPELSLDSPDELADALVRAGYKKFLTTPTGKRSTSVESIKQAVTSKWVAGALSYRTKLAYTLSNYLRPWRLQAEETGGTVHTSWNQVRQSQSERELGGTRSGRLSTDAPNLLAIAKKLGRQSTDYEHPTWIKGLAELPHVRRYMLPDKDHVWVRRDFNQQELRILAHYMRGELLEEYQRNPRLDVHEYVQKAILDVANIKLERDPTKVLNFGMIYGLGIPGLSAKLGITEERAAELKKAQRLALPGFKALEDDIKNRGRAGEPISTWGGRLYYVEPTKIIDGRVRDFAYKLINYRIQGSAADCTKEALCRYSERYGLEHAASRLLVAVHDEADITAPKGEYVQEAKRLGEVMQSIEFDVPMLSDAEYGPSWGDLKKLEE